MACQSMLLYSTNNLNLFIFTNESISTHIHFILLLTFIFHSHLQSDPLLVLIINPGIKEVKLNKIQQNNCNLTLRW